MNSDVEALAALDLGNIPEVLVMHYVRAVHMLQNAFVPDSNVPLARYTKGIGRGKSASATGARGFMHESRRVQHQDNPFKHAEEARAFTSLPSAAERASCPVPADIAAAIDFALLQGAKRLAGWRRHVQLPILKDALAEIADLETWVSQVSKESRPPHVARVADKISLVTLALIADSVRSPDVTLALRFKNGFQLCGDIEDSKMHRKIDERTPSEYLATVAHLTSLVVSWASLNEVQRKCAAAVLTTPAATRLELCRVTQEQINLGRMSTGLTKEQLCQHLWGKRDVPRDEACVPIVSSPPVSLRFALWQNDKLRPIDDCCNSNVGVNALLHLKETICPISADWPAIVAAHVQRQSSYSVCGMKNHNQLFSSSLMYAVLVTLQVLCLSAVFQN